MGFVESRTSMTANSSTPIPLHSQKNPFASGEDLTLVTVIDQLNYVTERLAFIEEQIANGTLIINQQPTGHLRLTDDVEAPQPARTGSQSGWQPTR